MVLCVFQPFLDLTSKDGHVAWKSDGHMWIAEEAKQKERKSRKGPRLTTRLNRDQFCWLPLQTQFNNPGGEESPRRFGDVFAPRCGFRKRGGEIGEPRRWKRCRRDPSRAGQTFGSLQRGVSAESEPCPSLKLSSRLGLPPTPPFSLAVHGELSGF